MPWTDQLSLRAHADSTLHVVPFGKKGPYHLWKDVDSRRAPALSWPPMASRSLQSPSVEAAVLTLEEVAIYLRVSKKTAYRLAWSGEFPAFKAANHWRVLRADLDGWIKRRTFAESRR
jgi:excisionase family DNA binding protein